MGPLLTEFFCSRFYMNILIYQVDGNIFWIEEPNSNGPTWRSFVQMDPLATINSTWSASSQAMDLLPYMGMLGTFSPPPTSHANANKRSRHASRHVCDARAVMHVGIAKPRWRGKRSRHSRWMRNPHFYVSVKRPIQTRTETPIVIIGCKCKKELTSSERHGFLLLTDISWVWDTDKYLHAYLWWNVNIHTCPDFHGSWDKPPLNLGMDG